MNRSLSVMTVLILLVNINFTKIFAQEGCKINNSVSPSSNRCSSAELSLPAHSHHSQSLSSLSLSLSLSSSSLSSSSISTNSFPIIVKQDVKEVPVNNYTQTYFLEQDRKVIREDSEKRLGLKRYIHTVPVLPGPENRFTSVRDCKIVNPDSRGDYVCNHEDLDGILSIHTFTVVNMVLDMYRQALSRIGHLNDFSWQWGNSPLQIFPDKGEEANAYYSRNDKMLAFFHFTGIANFNYYNRNSKLIYTALSLDIVAHETGHAVLDALRPDLLEVEGPNYAQAGAIHEAFGDLTAIFLMLLNDRLRQTILEISRVDLLNDSFLPYMAEEMGAALGRPQGIRNALNRLKLGQVSSEVHDLSQVLSGAIYYIFAKIYNLEKANNREYNDPSSILKNLTQDFLSLFLKTILSIPANKINFETIALSLEANAKKDWKKIIHEEFWAREILQSPTTINLYKKINLKLNATNCKRCCGTIRRLIKKDENKDNRPEMLIRSEL